MSSKYFSKFRKELLHIISEDEFEVLIMHLKKSLYNNQCKNMEKLKISGENSEELCRIIWQLLDENTFSVIQNVQDLIEYDESSKIIFIHDNMLDDLIKSEMSACSLLIVIDTMNPQIPLFIPEITCSGKSLDGDEFLKDFATIFHSIIHS